MAPEPTKATLGIVDPTTTIVEPNLKQALLNTGQDGGRCQVHTWDIQKIAMPLLTYFLPTYLPATCDQAHPVQLGQPTSFTDMKTTWHVILHESQHSGQSPVFGQVALIG